MDGHQKLLAYCEAVLKQNDLGGWTRPAPGVYPHQWLWDSCFIAIGQRHYDVARAQKEVKNIFRGQWHNGMIPNIVMGTDYKYGDRIWNSRVNKNSPKNIQTSGITQPPMLAEAIVKIGEKLTSTQRQKWYQSVFPDLLRYHEWLYRERDPRGVGLAVLVHPWESGLDNNPAWMREIHLNQLPLWITLTKKLKFYRLFNLIRKDTNFLPAEERIDIIDALSLFHIARRLKRKKYDTRAILRHSSISIEDLTFNAILIRANAHLATIAQTLDQQLPPWLWERMKKAPHAMELMWSEVGQQYFSRSYDTFELINEPSIATFLPLYAGTISQNRAKHLVELLKSRNYFTKYPVPSVGKGSRFFQPNRYWQGPVWINTNWLIIDGLERYGFIKEAQQIRSCSIELVATHGAYEYFNPLTGAPLGAHLFSWTAALTIDMLNKSIENIR